MCPGGVPVLGGRGREKMAEKEGAKVGAEEMEEREREREAEEVEVKFRLFDGSDIGPVRCNAAATTVAALKDRVVADWPKGPLKTPVPLSRRGVPLPPWCLVLRSVLLSFVYLPLLFLVRACREEVGLGTEGFDGGTSFRFACSVPSWFWCPIWEKGRGASIISKCFFC